MTDLNRENRIAQLRVLQQSDPRSLIELYCKITGQSAGGQLPYQTSFSRMIATIVEYEYGLARGPRDSLARWDDKAG